MADEVHVHQEPPPTGNGGRSTGWIVALLVVVVLVMVMWFVFMRGGADNDLPEQIDVDINVPTQTGG